MVDWRKLERATDRRVGGTFGETVRLSFMHNGTSDAERPQTTIRCLALHTGGDDSHPASGSPVAAFRTRLAAGEAELFLDRATYDGPRLRKGDRVRAMDRDGEPVWEVAGVSDRYSNLIVVSLHEL